MTCGNSCTLMTSYLEETPRKVANYVGNFFRILSTPSRVSNLNPNIKKASVLSKNLSSKGSLPNVKSTSIVSESEVTIDSVRPSDLDDEVEILSPEENELIVLTWSDDFNWLFELGSKIYIYIFTHNPECRTLFPAVHAHGDNYQESKEFKSLALKFVTTISFAVKNLHHPTDLNAHLYTIGSRHIHFTKRGFRPEFWNIFQDAMEFSLTDRIAETANFDDDRRKRAINAWRHLALYIITFMKRGYFDALESMTNRTV
ncbi:Globin [Aphelenchoides besseyi]|nr:Globin [Aphelenchoides besseyi]